MRNIRAIGTTSLILVITLGCWFANLSGQTETNQESVETEPAAVENPQEARESRPRTSFVKMVDFYLRDNKFVFGKLVSEDKNKLVVEQLDQSRIVASTYSKKEIDVRTLRTQRVPEARYYVDLGEYFSGRTWDFNDDPDDFIQAIRSYEKAKQLFAETRGEDSDKIDEIDKKIKQLQEDRQVWTREAESRARLKKLEFEAEIEKRFKALEDKVNKGVQQIDETVAKIKDDYQAMERSVTETGRDLSRRLDVLQERVGANTRLLDDLLYPRYYQRRYYYP
ncbi:MAG TPA: hypothetical protein VMW16_11465 [Sedimentisphaerales bacterium]|nr:hypothetical protein [Sedimentisphaerales bacterium]